MDSEKGLEDRLFVTIITYSTQPREVIPILKEAVRRGLHEEDRDIPFGERGVKYNVGEYVLGLCERYRIKIPEK